MTRRVRRPVTGLVDAQTLNSRAAQMALDGNTLGATAAAIAAIQKLIEHIEGSNR